MIAVKILRNQKRLHK